jgi:hypothetical protein
LSTPQIVAALGPILDLLRKLEVRHFVGGSVASSAHGVARTSVDAGVVAELEASHVSAFVAALRDAYYVPEERIREAVGRKGSFNLIHLVTMLKVDVFVSRGRPFDHRALERRQTTHLEGHPLPISSAEDTVLAKLEWYRKGGEVSERQWMDVLGVFRASAGALDVPYLRRGARELGVADLLERALGEADLDS